jgi:chemotaxis protein MotB
LAETTELAETRSKEKAESEKELQETNRINQELKARVKSYAVSRAVAIILMSISLAVAGYTTFTGQGYPDRKRGADRQVEELNAMLEKKDQVIDELSREQNRLTARADNLNKQLRRQTGRPAPPSESKELTYRTSTVVYFTLGSIGLSEQGAAKVRLLAEKIKTMPGGDLIRVEGHSDNKPLGRTSKVKHNDNKGLSKSRASVVARLLIEEGVDASRISIVGFGTNRPIVPNDSPENRDKNRRVEIKVASNGG